MPDQPPDAFLGYTRFDDAYHGGAISEFRDRLSDAVRAVTARSFEIFQDVDGIGLGQNWRKRLNAALGEARFFIPILTPNYFESEACRGELETFLAFERASGREDLVLPIHWIRCPVLEVAERRAQDPLAEIVNERQRKDWRSLRHKPYADPEVREALEALAELIDEARTRVVPASGSPTAQSPSALTSGTVFRDIDAPWCPEMVVIPPGTFLMGSPEGEEGRYDSEGPQHPVTIAYGLAVGRYPVTFEEYDHFCAVSSLEPPPDENWGRGRRPVINISDRDLPGAGADYYVEWLAGETGEAYRLLSEAEWEYACRAGTTTRYWWGDEISPKNANYGDSKLGKTTGVGAYPPNPFGLYETHGNVWEWCEDGWHGNYRGAPDDGSAWRAGNDFGRVVRGGSWGDDPVYARSACRGMSEPDVAGYLAHNLGFRVARTL